MKVLEPLALLPLALAGEPTTGGGEAAATAAAAGPCNEDPPMLLPVAMGAAPCAMGTMPGISGTLGMPCMEAPLESVGICMAPMGICMGIAPSIPLYRRGAGMAVGMCMGSAVAEPCACSQAPPSLPAAPTPFAPRSGMECGANADMPMPMLLSPPCPPMLRAMGLNMGGANPGRMLGCRGTKVLRLRRGGGGITGGGGGSHTTLPGES